MTAPSTARMARTTLNIRSAKNAGRLRRRWAGLRRIERACLLIGALLIASGVFHFGVFLVRGGPWEGPVSWRKPTTFGLSFGLTLITIAWVASYLTLRPRVRAWLLGVFAGPRPARPRGAARRPRLGAATPIQGRGGRRRPVRGRRPRRAGDLSPPVRS